jgi:GH25 family lysozyme M1 (1,4-beta-N-acetylmuramidase)
VDLATAKTEGGLRNVIHRATQGLTYTDPLYTANRAKADEAGLLVLDFEANPQGPSMTLEEARAFVTHIQEATGRWPGLCGGHYLKALLGTNADAVLANCWFWLSQYGPTAVVPPNWKTWTMWQYTDGGMGPTPHEIVGIGRCDRDLFNGTATALRKLWRAA